MVRSAAAIAGSVPSGMVAASRERAFDCHDVGGRQMEFCPIAVVLLAQTSVVLVG